MLNEAQIQAELQSAMRAREMPKVYVLRGLVAAIKNLKVEKQVKELPEAEITALVKKEVSKRTEALTFAEQGGRTELIEQNRAEIALLEVYLPHQLDAAELEAAIRSVSAELGTTQIGPLMAEIKKRYAGQYDGKLASELVKKLSA
jgi:uncharacterized protein YqeY